MPGIRGHGLIRGTNHRVGVGFGKPRMIGIPEEPTSLLWIRPIGKEERPHGNGLRREFGMGIQKGRKCAPVTPLIPEFQQARLLPRGECPQEGFVLRGSHDQGGVCRGCEIHRRRSSGEGMASSPRRAANAG